jgi:O-antigen ligase
VTTTQLPPLKGRAPAEIFAPAGERWGWAAIGLIVLIFAASAPFGFTVGIAALTVLGFVGALVGLLQPAVGFLSVVLLCVLDAPARGLLPETGLFRWNTLNYWLLLVAVLALPRLARLRDGPTLLLVLLALLLGIEILLSDDVALGLQQLANLLAAFGLLAYARPVATRRSVWTWAGLIGGTAGATGGLVYFLQQTDLPAMNPNAWAYMPLGGLFAICLAFSQNTEYPRRQLFLGGLAVLNSTWVFLSGSRGGLLVAVCCLAYLLAATRGLSRRAVMAVAAGLIVLTVSSFFTEFQDYALGRLTKLVNPAMSLSNRTSGRSDLMLGGFYIFQDRPFGVGTGGFETAWATLGPQEGLSGFRRGEKAPAHAGWIEILVENGVPGILLLSAFVLSFAVTAVSVRDRGTRRLGYLVTVALATAWVSTEFQARSLWLLAAGTATLVRAHRFQLRGKSEQALPPDEREVADGAAP